MLVKCDSCKREFDLPADKFHLEDSRFFCPECRKSGNKLSARELEFTASEFQSLIKSHHLRNSEREISKMLDMTAEMIKRGVIKQTPEGIGQLWAEIFKRSPELEPHLQKFISALWRQTLEEKEQEENPQEE